MMKIKMILSVTVLTLASNFSYSQIKNADWPCYGNDAGGSRYSILNQINQQNVSNLKPAWTFETGELKTYEGTKAKSKAAFEATPIMIDNTLYFSTPSDRVFALNAVTGKQKWMFDPQVNLHNDFSEISSRGVSAWPVNAADKKAKRIFVATIDGRLIALDAKTGGKIPGFGKNGEIDLQAGLGRGVSATSPPAIIGNLVITGSSMGDNQRYDYPPGVVRAYDVITGALRWTWDPIPQDSTDKAWTTWNGPKSHKTGAANAWSIISVDAKRDLVFIPTTCPSPDYYGGERLGQNLYANSIVALKASTGKLVWYYQVVHHDIWDYDIAAQPMLIEIKKDGKNIPAVAVGTKMGFIFILDRETGKPLFPVEERPVPQTDIPGEETSKTQPFPVLPAPLGMQSVSVKDAWGITEKDKEDAAKRISLYINKGTFTPPSFQGSLMTPGNIGGIHWGGMCFDPQQQLLVTNINRIVPLIRVYPREKLAEAEKASEEVMRAETGRQLGTPYEMKRTYLIKEDKNGLAMQTAPPWGTLLAIDLHDGQKKWEDPLGYMLDIKKYPEAEKWGSLNFGGAIVTAGNLTFVAGTFDNHLRAFNTKTGEMLWQYSLPASAQATPMVYAINGKQYVVICAGGHGKLGTKLGDFVMAFTL